MSKTCKLCNCVNFSTVRNCANCGQKLPLGSEYKLVMMCLGIVGVGILAVAIYSKVSDKKQISASAVTTYAPEQSAALPTPAVQGAKGSDDIALLCKMTNSMGVAGSDGKSYVLIYSPTHSVGKFGPEKQSGEWDPEYKINGIEKSINEVTFQVRSYNWMFVQRLNPQAVAPDEKLTVNRASLVMQYYSYAPEAGAITATYKCELLSEDKFLKHVKWVSDNTQKLQGANKI